MSSHQLAIAKASFSAGLLRPDPASISRDEIAHFHTLLNLIVIECSPANIQKCKRWVLRNITQSTARVTALGKYLTALSISFSGPAKSSVSTSTRREPSAKRKRIHILYLVNDILHHAKYHMHDASVAAKLQTSLVGLFSDAASFRYSPKHQQKIEHLLEIWEERQYYSTENIGKLREAVKTAADSGGLLETSDNLIQSGAVDTRPRSQKNLPFSMPAMHGDQSTPWYDLPAGNLMPHIVPNSTRPINPTLVKPLRFVAGPADEILVNAVKNLLSDVENIFETAQGQNHYEGVSWDIDELGQAFIPDETSGEIRGVEGYYGWSKAFCEKMRRYGNGIKNPNSERHLGSEGTSRSRSSSQNSIRRGGRLKRRYSDSVDSRSRSRSRSRRISRTRPARRSFSSSESPQKGRSLSNDGDRRRRTSRGSTPESATRKMTGHHTFESVQMPQSHSDHRYPDQIAGDSSRIITANSLHLSYPYKQEVNSILPAPHNLLHSNGHQFASGVIPIPPPPPPQYQGQWPAQPPIVTYGQQAQPGGAWPPPPPAFLQGAQGWQTTLHGQQDVGSVPWVPTVQPQQGRSGGAYSGRDRGGQNIFQTLHQRDGSAYNRDSGSGRGKEWR